MTIPRMDVGEAALELARVRVDAGGVSELLARIAQLTKASIPQACEVSVTVVRADRAQTAAQTGELAPPLDLAQYEAGTGPCLDAAREGRSYSILDMSNDKRWPHFRAAALRHGVHSTLSIGLPLPDAESGCLNLYAEQAFAFDDDAITAAECFAVFAAVAIGNVRLYEQKSALNRHMQDALESRAVIEQAKGILMARHTEDAELAFERLVQMSTTSNRKVREIAQEIVSQATRLSA